MSYFVWVLELYDTVTNSYYTHSAVKYMCYYVLIKHNWITKFVLWKQPVKYFSLWITRKHFLLFQESH